MSMKSLQCAIQAPTYVSLTSTRRASSLSKTKESHPQGGCVVIDLGFPNTLNVDVDEITFKNYYVASVTLFARKRGDQADAWRLCVRPMNLMPDPHCERAAEDYFAMTSKDFKFPLQNVCELRFLLRQPSLVWKEFKIEDIQVRRLTLNNSKQQDMERLPAWIAESGPAGKNGEEAVGGYPVAERKLEGIGPVADLSKHMQALWALTEQATAAQTTTVIGRYDIDGCYDINLLSYT